MSDQPQPVPTKTRRSWKSRLLELAFWALVAVGIAVTMIYFANRLLPNNF
jgi:hypothetical protein